MYRGINLPLTLLKLTFYNSHEKFLAVGTTVYIYLVIIIISFKQITFYLFDNSFVVKNRLLIIYKNNNLKFKKYTWFIKEIFPYKILFLHKTQHPLSTFKQNLFWWISLT